MSKKLVCIHETKTGLMDLTIQSYISDFAATYPLIFDYFMFRYSLICYNLLFALYLMDIGHCMITLYNNFN